MNSVCLTDLPNSRPVLGKRALVLLGVSALMVVFMAMLCVGSASAAGPTYVYNDISTDTTWNEAGSPYIVNQSIMVENGATLTIGENVTVYFDSGVDLTVNGALVAAGSVDKMITLTGNGSAIWGGIQFTPYSSGSSMYMVEMMNTTSGCSIEDSPLTLDNVWFSNMWWGASYYLVNESIAVSVTNCHFEDMSSGYALLIETEAFAYGTDTTVMTAPITITNNEFDNYGSVAIYLLRYACAYDNSTAQVLGDVLISGNTIDQTSGTGTGIYLMFETDTLDNATSEMSGSVVIDGNDIMPPYYYGIMVYRGVFAQDENSTASMDLPILITNNNFEGGYYGVYSWSEAYTDGYGTGSLSGDIVVQNNEAEDIYYWFSYADMEVYCADYSQVSVDSELEVLDNTVNDCGGLAYISYYDDSNYFVSYDEAVADVSCPIAVMNNVATNTTSGAWVYLDAEAYAESIFVLNAPICVQGNSMSEGDDDVIHVMFYLYAEENATLSATGDVLIAWNEVETFDGTAIYADVEVEAYTHTVSSDCSAVYDGDVYVVDNIVCMLYDADYGIDVYMNLDAYAYAKDSTAYTEVGNVLVARNVITGEVEDAYGIYFDPDLECEATNGGSVEVFVGTLIVENNEVELVGDDNIGIYLYADYFYAEAQGSEAVLTCSVWTTQDNVVELTGEDCYGIYVDDLGDYVYATVSGGTKARAELVGGFNVIGNDVTIMGEDSTAIYFLSYDETYAEANGEDGSALLDYEVFIGQNVISIEGDDCYGIYVEYETYAYYYEGIATLWGCFSIVENEIWAYGGDTYGMYVEAYAYLDENSDYGEGILAAELLVSDNFVTGAETGIFLYGLDEDVEAEVAGNHVQECYYGLYLMYSSAYVHDNYLTKNLYGMYVYSCDDLVVEDNLFYMNDDYGAYFTCGTGAENVVIGNNTFSQNWQYGLYITSYAGATIYNGVYEDNSYYGLYVSASMPGEPGASITGVTVVDWVIDDACVVKNNDVRFFGKMLVVEGGELTLDKVYFGIGEDGTVINGLHAEYPMVKVCEGGKMVAHNTYFDAYYGGYWLFEVYGCLEMMNCYVWDAVEVYLAPTSEALLSTTTVEYCDRNGIRVDNCDPVIRGCVIVNNDMDGIYVEGEDARPVIKNCLFMYNERGIYAYESCLDAVIDNVFLSNDMAGIYAESVVGVIHDNVFLFNQKEIYLVDCAVSVEDNQIGYADMIGAQSPYASFIMQLVMDLVDVNINLDILGEMPDAPSAPYLGGMPLGYMLGEVLAMSFDDHIGVYAYMSEVELQDNEYGSLQYALYSVESEILFSDCVKTNYFTVSWYTNNGTQISYDLPFAVYDGIFATGSWIEIVDASFEVMDDAIFLENCHAVIGNCEFEAGDFDIYLMEGTDAMVYGEFGEYKIEDTSILRVAFLLSVHVKDQDGQGIAGANVSVEQGTTLWASGKTDKKGVFECYIPAYSLDSDGNKVEAGSYDVKANLDTANGTGKVTMGEEETSVGVKMALKKNSFFGMDPIVLAAVALVVVALIVGALLLARRK